MSGNDLPFDSHGHTPEEINGDSTTVYRRSIWVRKAMGCGQRQILFEDYYTRVSAYSKLVAAMRDHGLEDEDFRKSSDQVRAALLECERARRALEGT